jgi:hypothetical protein
MEFVPAALQVCKKWNMACSAVVLGLKGKPVQRRLYECAPVTSSIHRLYEDILFTIFSHLETRGILTVRQTCKSWNVVVSESPALWSKKVLLIGSTEQVDRQWTKLKNRMGTSKVQSLVFHLKEKEEELHRYWVPRFTRVVAFSSFTLLQSLDLSFKDLDYCTQEDLDYFHEAMWEFVQSCSQLKVLRLKTVTEQFHFMVKATPLAGCRLRVLDLSFDRDERCYCTFDDEFYSVLQEVKELLLDCYVSYKALHHMLDAAKDTLEKLDIVYSPTESTYSEDSLLEDHEPIIWNKERALNMRRLTYFSGAVPISYFKLKMPLLATMKAYANSKIIDLYQNSLEEVHYGFWLCLECCRTNDRDRNHVRDHPCEHKQACTNDEQVAQFRSRFFKLPKCHTLTMNFSLMVSKRQMDICKALTLQCDGGPDILANLKHLTIMNTIWYDFPKGTRFFTGQDLLTFLDMRRDRALPDLESLKLIRCPNFSLQSLVQIKQMVQHFSYMKSDWSLDAHSYV